jgi:hypothetical protein
MTSMIERVARAIYREFENRPPYAQIQTNGIIAEMNGIIAEECARAAIEEMRKPTDAMVERGAKRRTTIQIGTSAMSGSIGDGAAKDVWRVMIDSALRAPLAKPAVIDAALKETELMVFATLSVVSAAIRFGDLIVSLPAPARHHNILHAMIALGSDFIVRPEDQGFMLSDGTFAERKYAAWIARNAGQIVDPNWPPYLHSEDLW